MPITVIAMIVVGLLYTLWPAPKIDQGLPPHRGNYAPDILTVAMGTDTYRSGSITSFEAGVTIPISTDTTKNVPIVNL